MNLITIVMPAFNVENYIGASIESVLNQSYTNWELIIVNDGSTDNTQKIIEEYLTKNSCITLINQKNQGVAAARNTGLNHAKGDFISFLDSDDCYHPDYLKLMSEPLHDEEIGLSFCKFQEIDSNKKVISQTTADAEQRFTGSFIKYISDTKIFTTANMAVMYKLSVIRQHNFKFYNGSICAEDAEFLFKYIYLENTVLVPYYLYYYTARPDSLSRKEYSYDMFFDEVDAYLRTLNFMNKNKGIDKADLVHFLTKNIIIAKNRIKRVPWRAIKDGKFCEATQFLDRYQQKYGSSFSLSIKEIDSKNFWLKVKILASKNKFLWNLSKNHKQK